jgi:hypothetical protein
VSPAPTFHTCAASDHAMNQTNIKDHRLTLPEVIDALVADA